MELPRGVWRWISENGRDLARIASAAERIAEELAAIRRTLQEQDDQEEQSK
jgi:hypothetical protein